MKETPHEFDYLSQWSGMDEVKLVSIINSQSIIIMEKIVTYLTVDDERNAYHVNYKSFSGLVKEMYARCREGSNQLGRVIIEAGEYKDSKKYVDAILVLEKYLDECRYPFYKEIATNELLNIKDLLSK